ncbi:HesA/MoeB/ThiF family protein [Calderihabitans maritimus]|uniref:UBA/THIF-type NAD/FAD binding fold n=1 Tax=Calderihabitans maritimus TaxID=1246530 RepID=A0A1Z5HWQ6_9FIRM|nr:molybdopterin-synthase adenylyltransferase MoeB [Calderihabitans maritimus]GAW93745.1 UBA/THIF-type NAD/FAD binding fold [Calderihabitans maritimus]
MNFNEEQILRYSRQIILPEVGGKGQEKLLQSRVLIVGAGGLGSPVAYYLTAAGVGHIGIVDSDVVDLSNLQRQILHRTADVGKRKVDSAQEKLEALNPDVEIITYHTRLGKENVRELIADYDLIIDGVDNFPARYLLNDACVLSGKTLVEAGILRWDGMVMTIKPGEGPCYRCVFPSPPPPGAVPSCQEAGVIGAVAGVMGVLQAGEALKILLGVGKPLVGRLLIFDALESRFREVEVARNPKCPVCGDEPAITELVEYDLHCQIRGR